MQKRKPIPKNIRLKVYEKYNGHCAYCGCEITYKQMQVDHMIPVYKIPYVHINDKFYDDMVKFRNEMERKVYSEDNLMPTCRSCNKYKAMHDLESFRENIERIPERMGYYPVFNLGLRYGTIIIPDFKCVFYFERFENE